MATDRDDSWLHARHEISIVELAECAGLSETEVRELVEYGALSPSDVSQWTFSSSCVARVRTATRLRRDLELDTAAFALVMSFLEQIEDLQSRVRELSAHVQSPQRK
jgi:chaperone modulatory protein CbpM